MRDSRFMWLDVNFEKCKSLSTHTRTTRQDSEYIKVVIKIVTLDPMPVVISNKFFINVETEYSNSI